MMTPSGGECDPVGGPIADPTRMPENLPGNEVATMSLSAFAEKSKKPSETDLAQTLGRSRTHWKAIVDAASEEFPPLEEIWKHSGAAWGWALQLKQKKRAVLYLTPCRRHFVAGLILGEKAVRAARRSELSPTVLDVISESKKYAEGRAIRWEVRNRGDREAVLALARIKMAH